MVLDIQGGAVGEVGQRVVCTDVPAIWTCPGGDVEVGWFTFSVYFWCFAPYDDGGSCYCVEENGGEGKDSAEIGEEHFEGAISRRNLWNGCLVRILVRVEGYKEIWIEYGGSYAFVARYPLVLWQVLCHFMPKMKTNKGNCPSHDSQGLLSLSLKLTFEDLVSGILTIRM